ncbi:unnamed protein product [Paramecium primaurelia]|uniref:Uncharacterized protein n=1 Tax=Paramecium primaurelia TaxID=5886 RepID=A0A8S1MD00_PARPR|nr:unnamed protein product [Paramecium primaurelia]
MVIVHQFSKYKFLIKYQDKSEKLNYNSYSVIKNYKYQLKHQQHLQYNIVCIIEL